jgi:hypothetical protein
MKQTNNKTQTCNSNSDHSSTMEHCCMSTVSTTTSMVEHHSTHQRHRLLIHQTSQSNRSTLRHSRLTAKTKTDNSKPQQLSNKSILIFFHRIQIDVECSCDATNQSPNSDNRSELDARFDRMQSSIELQQPQQTIHCRMLKK